MSLLSVLSLHFSCTSSGCTFSSVTGDGSGACLFKSTGGSVFVSGTTKFKDLQLPAEALRFDNTAVSVDNVQFEGGKMAEALRVSGGTLQRCSNLKFASFPDMSGDGRYSKNIVLITGTVNVPPLEHIEFKACKRQLEFMKLDPNVQLGEGFLVNDFKVIENCWTRNGFFKCSVDKEITMTNSAFENSKADWQFVIFDGGCTLQEITFTSCTGQILQMDKSKKVSVFSCTFTECSGNLIEIKQTSGFNLRDCCFQRNTNGYDIKVDSGSVVCEYPLCFSRNRDASVKFASYPPSLAALEKQYQIFGCTTCDNPPPTPTPVATPTQSPVPRPTPTGEIPPEPEETTTSDEETSSEPSDTVTSEYPAEPTGARVERNRVA